MRKSYHIITTIILHLFFICGIHAQMSPICPKREMRAVWLTTLSGLDWPRTKATSASTMERQKEELCAILDQLQSANFNAVVMQVRTRAAVLYPSMIEPWDVCLTGKYGKGPGYDPLAFAIDQCHKRGMQLHAWLVAIPGNKATQSKAMGGMALEKRRPDLCLRTSEGYMLNPGLKESAEYLASLCEEITRNYDVDGISLDYIRYPEKEIKFNDNNTYKKFAQQHQSLTDWRRDNISRCVKMVHDKVKAIKPWVALSCSPVGKYNDTKRYSSGGWNAYRAVAQDAKLWLKEGWMDFLMPMMYFRGNNYFPFALDWQEESCSRHITPGLGVYLIDSNQKDWDRSILESEIEFGRQHNLAGHVFFRSRFITNNTKGIYNLLKNDLYYTKALMPALPTSNVTAPQPPTHGTIKESSKGLTLSWQPDSDDCTYIVYRSNHYPVDTDKATNIYINTRQTTIEIPTPYPLSIAPFFAVTAINRYGAESKPLELNTQAEFIKVKSFVEEGPKNYHHK